MRKLKPNPLFKDFPKELKDTKRFLEIEKKIDLIMHSDHKHVMVKAFVNCKRCQEKFNKKRAYIKSLGFKDIHQYQMWKRIMPLMNQIIKQRDERM